MRTACGIPDDYPENLAEHFVEDPASCAAFAPLCAARITRPVLRLGIFKEDGS
jgi:hypothetical protein